MKEKEKKKIEIQIGFGPSPSPKDKEGKSKVEVSSSTMHLLPAPADACQECAVKHEPSFPHNRDSLFYQMHFRKEHGRWPTWADAIAHCDERAKPAIKALLEREGVWSEPVEGMTEEEKAARAVGGLPTHSTKPDGGKYFMEVIEIEEEDEEAPIDECGA